MCRRAAPHRLEAAWERFFGVGICREPMAGLCAAGAFAAIRVPGTD